MKKFLPKTLNNPQVYTERSRSGFTLVELLVVIAIIAILSVIGITIYSGIQITSRDSRRVADIQALGNAMEANYGKTTAGQYDKLSAAWLSGGVAVLDPVEKNTGCGDATGSLPCKYCYKQGTTAQSASTCTAASSALVTGGVFNGPTGTSSNPYWMICANLEKQNAAGLYYVCRANQQ